METARMGGTLGKLTCQSTLPTPTDNLAARGFHPLFLNVLDQAERLQRILE